MFFFVNLGTGDGNIQSDRGGAGRRPGPGAHHRHPGTSRHRQGLRYDRMDLLFCFARLRSSTFRSCSDF